MLAGEGFFDDDLRSPGSVTVGNQERFYDDDFQESKALSGLATVDGESAEDAALEKMGDGRLSTANSRKRTASSFGRFTCCNVTTA